MEEHAERMWELGRIVGMSEALHAVASRTTDCDILDWCRHQRGRIQTEYARLARRIPG